MEWFSKGMLFVHIVAGALSLVLFWIPVFTKKGGNIHRKVGVAYVWLMWVVVFTAFLMCVQNAFQGAYTSAFFLGFLSVITSKPLWMGMAILNNKKSYSHRFRQVYFVLGALTFIYGIVMIIGVYYFYPSPMAYMMLFFGVLGLLGGGSLYREWKTSIKSYDWFREHYVGLLISGGAAYTAFFAFGGRSIFGDAIMSGYWSVVAWTSPTIIVLIVIQYYDRFYKKGRYEEKLRK